MVRQWRLALWRIATGPLAGWICLAGTFLVVGVYGLLRDDAGWYLTYPGPWVAAVVLNACTWLAAMLCGQTRQLRASWLGYIGLLAVFFAAGTIWPSWGRDLDMVMVFSLIDLGFPITILRRLATLGKLHQSWGLKRALDVMAPWDLLVLPYLQAFVLLPLLFRWRARAVARHVDEDARRGRAAPGPPNTRSDH